MSATHKHETVGEKQHKASLDSTKYDAREVAYGRMETAPEMFEQCAKRHCKIFDEDEFFVVSLIVYDPMIKNLRRNKYYADLFMPAPRPQQTVFLYNKVHDTWRYMWTIPDPVTIVEISEALYVPKEDRRVKQWIDAIYNRTFWPTIRKMHGIDHLSREEFVELNRDKIPSHVADKGDPLRAETFDFSKVNFGEVGNPLHLRPLQDGQNLAGKTKGLDRDIANEKV